jgi:hypothetical protein
MVYVPYSIRARYGVPKRVCVKIAREVDRGGRVPFSNEAGGLHLPKEACQALEHRRSHRILEEDSVYISYSLEA